MRTTDVELILEAYDEADNKRKAIMSLAKLIGVTPEEVIEKLKENGRKIDFTRKAKPKKKAEDPGLLKTEESGALKTEPTDKLPLKTEEQEAADPEQKALNIPEYVQDVLFEKFGQLERKLGELQQEYNETEQKYLVLKRYLFNN